MREILYGFQFTAWLVSLVLGAQATFSESRVAGEQALLALPYVVACGIGLFVLTWFYERSKHLAESEVTLDRLRRKHPQLFRQQTP